VSEEIKRARLQRTGFIEAKMSPFRRFVKQFSHFFAGFGLVQLFGFVTFPILTRALTKEQYGVMSLISTTMLLAVAISKAGLSDGIIRFYKEYSEAPEKRTIFSSTVLIRGLIFSVFSVLLYLAVIPVLNHYLKINRNYIICFAVMACYLFIHPLNLIVINFLRASGKTIFLNAVNLISAGVSVGLSLLLLIYFVRELYGYFIGVVMGEFAVAVILFSWFFKQYKVIPARASGALAIQLIKFGLPVLFTECGFLALSYVDRYLIVAYYDEAMLGLYSAGYNVAMYIANILMFSISYAIVPIYVDIYCGEGREKTEAFLQKCLNYLLIALIPICFGFLAVAKDLFITLASEKYAAAATFSPIILLGTIIFALKPIFHAGLYLTKRTMTMLSIMLLAVAVKVLMNILLLPAYGVMGAAISTLVPCGMVTLLNGLLSYKHISVKIDFKVIIYYVILSFCMFLIVIQINMSRVWLTLLTKVFVGCLIIGAGALYREREILEKLKYKLSWQNSRDGMS
jgi:O-antigen/teichoic acid export membrane protein